MLAALCGSLVIGGFRGTSLPEAFARVLRQRQRGGAILFKHNAEGGPRQVAALVRAIREAAGEAPIVSVDQEGGRVVRLGPPLLQVPSMRSVASWGDVGLAERIARAVGTELAALGFTVDFAPVLDVDTCPDNPIIGDRAYSDDPDTCARFGAAWIRGLQGAGLLACGKHFPGHGDTSTDSHLELPIVDRRREQLEAVEFVPFRAAVNAGVASMMTAHVVYRALDPDLPATLSHTACTELRGAIGFDGVLFSDDLGMRAIADRWPAAEAAVLAVAAGCDAVLVCGSEEAQVGACEALLAEAESSPAFADRCREAGRRLAHALRRVTARPLGDEHLAAVIGAGESTQLAHEIATRSSESGSR